MAEEPKGWQPDPFLVHEFRFYSDDGKPTLLVSDGGTKSYDPPPSGIDPRLARARDIPAELAAPSGADVEIFEDRCVQLEPDPDPAPVAFSAMGDPPGQVQFDDGDPAPLASRSAKIVSGVMLVAIAVSALALLIIHLGGHKTQPHGVASSTTTLPTKPTTTTLTLPAALKPSAAAAAADLISSWASRNQAQALTVATAPAVAVLFAGQYTPGLVIDRGCSVAFSPIVCTYGPPGGAAPTDPIYEIDVSEASGGWYVSAAKVEN
jgi:hypothetical protein